MGYASVFRPGLLAGRVGIVTGGGTGIGRCIAHEVSSLGATVVLASRTRKHLDRTRDEIAAAGGRADVVVCNVREPEQVEALVARTVERHGRLDFVVNNAGGQFLAPPESITPRGWRAVLETNLTGTFLMCQQAYRHWMRDHGGAIVNIVADFWNGMPMMAHTGAARAGVVNLTRSLALAWAARHVRVNAVAPGYIRSSGLRRYPPAVQKMLPSIAEQIPAGRFGTESEVSAAVVFLLSPAAAYVTGTTLRVDGGSAIYRQPMPVPRHAGFPRFEAFHLDTDAPDDV